MWEYVEGRHRIGAIENVQTRERNCRGGYSVRLGLMEYQEPAASKAVPARWEWNRLFGLGAECLDDGFVGFQVGAFEQVDAVGDGGEYRVQTFPNGLGFAGKIDDQ